MKKKLAKELRKERERQDVSQEALAKKAKVSTRSISAAEQGNVSYEIYIELFKALGVDMHFVLEQLNKTIK